jgi:hypothetical protein
MYYDKFLRQYLCNLHIEPRVEIRGLENDKQTEVPRSAKVRHDDCVDLQKKY